MRKHAARFKCSLEHLCWRGIKNLQSVCVSVCEDVLFLMSQEHKSSLWEQKESCRNFHSDFRLELSGVSLGEAWSSI